MFSESICGHEKDASTNTIVDTRETRTNNMMDDHEKKEKKDWVDDVNAQVGNLQRFPLTTGRKCPQ